MLLEPPVEVLLSGQAVTELALHAQLHLQSLLQLAAPQLELQMGQLLVLADALGRQLPSLLSLLPWSQLLVLLLGLASSSCKAHACAASCQRLRSRWPRLEARGRRRGELHLPRRRHRQCRANNPPCCPGR